MKLKVFLFVCLFLQANYFYSQLKGNSYQFPEKFSKSYFFDPVGSYQKIKDYEVSGISKENMDLYKIKSTYNLQGDFDNNLFYLEWYDLENYLDKLVDSILPQDLKSQQKFTVFIKRSSNFDIDVLGNGFIFISIGSLSVCKNEAELCFLLAHNIYHTFYNKNSLKIKMDLDALKKSNSKDIGYINKKLDLIFSENFGIELQADSFAYSCLSKSKLDLTKFDNIVNTLQYTEKKSFTIFSSDFSINIKDIVPSLLKKDTIFGRQQYLHEVIKNTNTSGSHYIIDSIYFHKIKKTAREECKKMTMEMGYFETTLKLAFVDYLLGDNGPKNLFYLIESTRRLIYRQPELLQKGFLAEDLQFTESFENTNASILKKPEHLFIDLELYNKAQKHHMISNEKKPFNTYEEAFWYFVKEAGSKNINEIEFSKALFYYSQKDEVNFSASLNSYIEHGGGLYSDFAENLQKFKMPYIKEGKTLVVIDYTGNSYRDNYYQLLDRKKYDPIIRQQFKFDSLKMALTILNDYRGTNPKMLNHYQKINNTITKLYNKTELEIFTKRKYLGKETMDDREKRNKYNKNIFIYNPDIYKWFSEQNYNGVFLQKINYDYPSETSLEEISNNYIIFYCNAFDNRPFFWISTRTNSLKKQPTKDMIKEGRDYLYYKE